jgi:hypothetical protein
VGTSWRGNGFVLREAWDTPKPLSSASRAARAAHPPRPPTEAGRGAGRVSVRGQRRPAHLRARKGRAVYKLAGVEVTLTPKFASVMRVVGGRASGTAQVSTMPPLVLEWVA